jgi:hypothetical protein
MGKKLAIIDTGAGILLINKTFIPKHEKNLQNTVKVKSACGSEIPIIGEIHGINIVITNEKITLSPFIVKYERLTIL